jgi:hypothetical protein
MIDEGIERIRRLSQMARQVSNDAEREAELEREAHAVNQRCLARLERAIPKRLRQLAAAADGDLTFEDSAYRSHASTAIQIQWRAGFSVSHAVELWLHRETGSVEWRWKMAYREPPIVHRVPASKFDLARLDELVIALAEPRGWQGGHPPEV